MSEYLTPMSKRSQQKSDTRHLIIDNAHMLFSAYGFTATPTLDIAKQAGISHGSIFAHFNTREDLIVSVVDAFAFKLKEKFEELQIQHPSFSAFLEAHLHVMEEFEPLYSRLIAEEAILPKEISQQLVLLQGGIAKYFHASLQEDPSILKDRLPPSSFIFNLWIGLLHYYLTRKSYFIEEGSLFKIKGPEIIHHFLQLIRK